MDFREVLIAVLAASIVAVTSASPTNIVSVVNATNTTRLDIATQARTNMSRHAATPIASFLGTTMATSHIATASPSALIPASNWTSPLHASSTPLEYFSGPWSSFPGPETWRTFEDLFALNYPRMTSGGNTVSDAEGIRQAIKESSVSYGVDERVLLVMIMQESSGNVGVITTYNADGVATAGIMQCSGCVGFMGQHGLAQEQITAMVRGGTVHFKRNMVNWGDLNSAQTYYPALREYNSGSVIPEDLSKVTAGTTSYVSDVVQRLQGWAP